MGRRRIESLINHWSVTYPESTVQDLRDIHVRVNKWSDIGYHRVILHPDSHEFKKRPTEWWQLVKRGRYLNDDLYIEQKEIGAHTLYKNSNSVGICTIGRPGVLLHPLQQLAVVMTNLTFLKRFKLPATAIGGHRDFNATECPGPDVYKLINELKRLLR